MQQCPKCSKTLPAFAKFCDECGTKIIIEPLRNDAVDKMSSKSEDATATDSTTPKQPILPIKKKSNKTGCIWAVVVVVIFAFMLIGHLSREEDRRTRERFEERRNVGEEGVVINGVRWATRNVCILSGAFAENPESNGGLFTWERARTVCPQGWRLPTDREFESLNNVNTRSEWTTLNGVNGRLFSSGRNQVFFPAAGMRNRSDDVINSRGIVGFYWSSTRSSDSDAWGFTFYGTNNRITSGRRAWLYSVRCVAK